MKITIALMLGLVALSCSSSNTTAPQRWMISAGTIGGVAGATTGYMLSSNGEVFKLGGVNGNRTQGDKVGMISRDEASAWSDRLEKSGFWKSDLNHPANVTFFIEETKGEAKHSVVWSDGTTELLALIDWNNSFKKMCAALNK